MSREFRKAKILARYACTFGHLLRSYLSFHLHKKLQPRRDILPESGRD